MKLYQISADNGRSYSEQWLTEKEVEELKADGYIVESAYMKNLVQRYLDLQDKTESGLISE